MDSANVSGMPVETMDGTDPARTAPTSVSIVDTSVVIKAVHAAEATKPNEAKEETKEKKPEEKSQDQIGKITNMISSDLRILQGGADWLTPGSSSSSLLPLSFLLLH